MSAGGFGSRLRKILMFKNRREAGQKLAKKLEVYRGAKAIVIALPRGGVVVGYEVARALSLPFDIIVVRKIGHPTNPEYAIGAVDEIGTTILNEDETATVDTEWLREEIAREQKEAKRRSLLYRKGRKSPNLSGKIIIILTMRLAVRSVKAQKPEKIIVAVPVASAESLRVEKDEGAHEIVVLEPPEEFVGAVGAHYLRFEQVEDEEVIRLLHP